MNDPLVSIVIPVYNCSEYVRECIESVLAQDHRNIEVLVIDDGSDDGSAELCRSLAEKDPRVTAHVREHGGVSAARNYGIRLAAGELITFVDADDYVEPQHISALVSTMLEQNADCAVSGYFLDLRGRSEKRVFCGIKTMGAHTAVLNMLDTTLYQGFLCNKLFRKSIIDNARLSLREDIFYCEDLLFCAEYFSNCSRVCCVGQAYYHYRRRKGSAVNGTLVSRMLTGVKAIEACGELFRNDSDISALAKARAQTERAGIFRRAYISGEDKHTLSKLKREMRTNKKAVLRSTLSIKEKIKYLSTCLFPRTASRLWVSRENRHLQ